jgi:nucleoside-diphosphate-sugar epimerase
MGLDPVLDQITLIEGDIRDAKEAWFDGVYGVIHLAGLSNDPTADFNQQANMEMNVAGTRKVAEAAKTAGVKKMILASSASIYYTQHGSMDDPVLDETTPVAPNANYSRSKYFAERQLMQLADENFAPAALRMGTLFGWSPRMRFDLVINTFLKDAYVKGRLTVHQGGEMYRPMLGIEDAADAYISLLHKPSDDIRGGVFNLVHKNYTVINLAHFTKHVLETKCGKKIEVDVMPRDASAPSRSYRMSGEKAERLLGIRAERGATEAIERIWNNIKDGQLNVEEPIHYNIAQLKHLIESDVLDGNTLRPKVAQAAAMTPGETREKVEA